MLEIGKEMIANYINEQSCRDDMESLGYLLLFLIRGSLTWQQVKTTTEERKLELIREMKETVSTEDLCNGLLKEFAAYFNHLYCLQFGDKPQYSYLAELSKISSAERVSNGITYLIGRF